MFDLRQRGADPTSVAPPGTACASASDSLKAGVRGDRVQPCAEGAALEGVIRLHAFSSDSWSMSSASVERGRHPVAVEMERTSMGLNQHFERAGVTEARRRKEGSFDVPMDGLPQRHRCTLARFHDRRDGDTSSRPRLEQREDGAARLLDRRVRSCRAFSGRLQRGRASSSARVVATSRSSTWTYGNHPR